MAPEQNASKPNFELRMYESIRSLYMLLEKDDNWTLADRDMRHLREFPAGQIPAAPPLFRGRLYENVHCLYGEDALLDEMYRTLVAQEGFVSEGGGRRCAVPV